MSAKDNLGRHKLASDFRIGIAFSTWHEEVVKSMKQAARQTLITHGIPKEHILEQSAAGSFELPLMAQHLLNTQHCDGVIALGCLIQGQTPHFHYICQATTQGLMQVSLQSGKPVGFGLLTTHTLQQAKARSSEHNNKGTEASLAMLHSLKVIKNYPFMDNKNS